MKYLVSWKLKGKGAWYSNKHTRRDRGLKETLKYAKELFSKGDVLSLDDEGVELVEEIRIKVEK